MAEGMEEIGPKDQQDQDQTTSQVLSSLHLPEKEMTEDNISSQDSLFCMRQ